MTPWLWAAAAGVLVVPVMLASVVAWTSLFPPRSEIAPPEIVADRVESVEIGAPGRSLRGWWLPGSGPARGCVLLVHGWGSGSGHMLHWAAFLAPAGWSCLAIDAGGHGRSDGRGAMTMPRFADDVIAAARHLGAICPARGPLVVLGHSMGGAASLLALSRGLPADAAIITSAFARVEVLTEYVLAKWLLPPRLLGPIVYRVWNLVLRPERMRDLEPETTVRAVRVPLLLVHGDQDPVIPDREMARLTAAAPPDRTETLIVEGATHSDLVEFPVYRDRVLAFLDRISPRTAGPGPS